jgi:hypothetical protein
MPNGQNNVDAVRKRSPHPRSGQQLAAELKEWARSCDLARATHRLTNGELVALAQTLREAAEKLEGKQP